MNIVRRRVYIIASLIISSGLLLSFIMNSCTKNIRLNIVETSSQCSKSKSLTSDDSSINSSTYSLQTNFSEKRERKSFLKQKSERMNVLIDPVCLSNKRLRGESETEITQLIEPDIHPLQLRRFNSSFHKPSRIVHSLKMPENLELDQIEDMANNDSCIISVSPPVKVKMLGNFNDTYYSRLNHLKQIHHQEAMDLIYPQNQTSITKDVVIAIIDTGVDINHEDLTNLWTNSKETANGLDDDGNGIVDDIHGANLISSKGDPTDDNGHGTHCSGLAAGVGNNGKGISGSMPFNAKIMGLKVLDKSGSGSDEDVANGIYYAIENGVNIISLSLGGTEEAPLLKTAITDAVQSGITVVVAAGNDNTSTIEYPSGYAKDIKGLISIGALDTNGGSRCSFSNFGTSWVELGAPGCDTSSKGLISTYPSSKGTYAYMEGTSMATPIVAGVVGIIYGWMRDVAKRTPSAEEVETILLSQSPSSSSLSSSFKEGKYVDLQMISKYLTTNYPIGGTGSPTPSPSPSTSPSPTQSPSPSPTSSPTSSPTPQGSPTPASSPSPNPNQTQDCK